MVQASKPEREAQSMFSRLLSRCAFWSCLSANKCVLKSVCVPLNSCMYKTFTISCIFEANMCVWLCAFPHLRKESVLHSTGERSHYRKRSWSLEATALHVVWIDWVSFPPKRAVEHTLCHYQCPAVHTSFPPYFSLKKIAEVDVNKRVSKQQIYWGFIIKAQI